MGIELRERGGYWYASGSLGGTRVRQSLGLAATKETKRQAKELALAIEKRVEAGRYGNQGKTLEQAVEKYREKLRQEGRNSRYSDRNLEKFRELYGRPLFKLEPDDFDTISKTWTWLKPNSISRALETMTAVLNHAVALRWIESAPKILKPRYNDERTVYLTDEQRMVLVKALKARYPQHYKLFLVLIYGGARLSEALALTNEHFFKDDEGDYAVKVTETISGNAIVKTRYREVPLPVWVAQTLLSLGGRGLLFTKGGAAYRSSNGASAVLNKTLKVIVKTAPELPQDLRVHDLRHSFAWMWAKQGADLGDLMYLLGHTKLQTTMRYRGIVTPRLKGALKGIK